MFVCVLDSGIGGLAICKSLEQNFTCPFVYFADSAFCPYGDLPVDVLENRLQTLCRFWKGCGAVAIVLACNTASVLQPTLQRETDVAILPIVQPTCQQIARQGWAKVCVLATKNTVQSGVYKSCLQSVGVEAQQIACPNFVPLVESGANLQNCLPVVAKSLALVEQDCQAIVLGCTHFGLLRGAMQQVSDLPILDCNNLCLPSLQSSLCLLGLQKVGDVVQKTHQTMHFCSANATRLCQTSGVQFNLLNV